MLLRSASFGNEQMSPRRLRLSFCREERRYIGNIWAARHNRYQMLHPGVMSVVGHLRRFWHVRVMSG